MSSDLIAVNWGVGVFVTSCALAWMLRRDAEGFLRRSRREPNVAPEIQTHQPNDWDQLAERAGKTVQAAIAELPDDVRVEARAVPVLCEERSERDGDGKVILGIYRGFTPDRVSAHKGPIVLYLRTIEEFAGRAPGAFEAQVRGTYLHELGHHLGWNEADVRARGL